jgi:hypothetical protein
MDNVAKSGVKEINKSESRKQFGRYCYLKCYSLEAHYENDPLVDHFNVYLQIFLSQALEPSFLSAIRKSQGQQRVTIPTLHGNLPTVS